MSPRSAAANRSLRDATRARLIAHALRLFGERGFASTPVSAIAESAGVSQGLLYHYFPGKTELLVAIFEETIRDVRESWARADAEPRPPLRLAALLRAIGTLIRERRDFWALSYGVRMQPEVLASLDAVARAVDLRDSREAAALSAQCSVARRGARGASPVRAD